MFDLSFFDVRDITDLFIDPKKKKTKRLSEQAGVTLCKSIFLDLQQVK